MTIAILFAAFFAALAAGVPVVWSMGIASVAALTFGDLSVPAVWYAQQTIRGADSLSLAAIPLFLFAGEIMNRGGLTGRIMRLAGHLFGRFTGGMGLVNVATAFVYGGISGSATADTGAVAKLMVDEMEERGYPRAFSAALTAASGTLGIIVPPSVVFIMYGVLTNTSIAGLFLAGILPGIVIAALFMLTSYIVGRRNGWRGMEVTGGFASFRRDFVAALPALGMPVFVLGSILGGFATATEAAALAVLYAFAVGVGLYREFRLRDLWPAAVETVTATGAIMMIMALATPFAWILTVEQLPTQAAAFITGLDVGTAGRIVLVVLLLLFTGLWLDLGPALIILAPILAPILAEAGIGPFQSGVLMSVALGIGLYTPPVGTNIFVVCNIARVDMWSVSKRLVPFWIASVVVLILLVLFPFLTEWLPRLLRT
ncbi:TRAP transporter large permease [Methylobrevis albus]|uniref:TRAP transporter large permease protein n=1 Tax=Methylobrevis albus TaxID=2793297 RepID=A0A931MYC2_9HYPH|nr:TRAP transporter large permease [Methylobrevis albus]MBH0238252.1 TRAP transporter large permease [Methylobrevis albus]